MKNNDLIHDCRINMFSLKLQSKILQFGRTTHNAVFSRATSNMFTAKIFNCLCTVFNKNNEMKC